jgi:hypothetical protein
MRCLAQLLKLCEISLRIILFSNRVIVWYCLEDKQNDTNYGVFYITFKSIRHNFKFFLQNFVNGGHIPISPLGTPLIQTMSILTRSGFGPLPANTLKNLIERHRETQNYYIPSPYSGKFQPHLYRVKCKYCSSFKINIYLVPRAAPLHLVALGHGLVNLVVNPPLYFLSHTCIT